MTVYLPAVAGVISSVVTAVYLQTIGITGESVQISAIAMLFAASVVYMYLPLPQTNGGMMGGSTKRYWGFTDDR